MFIRGYHSPIRLDLRPAATSADKTLLGPGRISVPESQLQLGPKFSVKLSAFSGQEAWITSGPALSHQFTPSLISVSKPPPLPRSFRDPEASSPASTPSVFHQRSRTAW